MKIWGYVDFKIILAGSTIYLSGRRPRGCNWVGDGKVILRLVVTTRLC